MFSATYANLSAFNCRAKRVERLLKRFDYKMSDITGGKMRGGPSPKKTDSATSTPSGRKRKVKQEDDISPSAKRATSVRAIKKEGVSNFKVFSGKSLFLALLEQCIPGQLLITFLP